MQQICQMQAALAAAAGQPERTPSNQSIAVERMCIPGHRSANARRLQQRSAPPRLRQNGAAECSRRPISGQPLRPRHHRALAGCDNPVAPTAFPARPGRRCFPRTVKWCSVPRPWTVSNIRQRAQQHPAYRAAVADTPAAASTPAFRGRHHLRPAHHGDRPAPSPQLRADRGAAAITRRFVCPRGSKHVLAATSYRHPTGKPHELVQSEAGVVR